MSSHSLFSNQGAVWNTIQRGVKNHIQELGNAELLALNSLQDVRCRWYDPNDRAGITDDHEMITGTVSLASIRGAAQQELQRRRHAAPVAQPQREFREVEPFVPKFATTDTSPPRPKSLQRFLGLFKRT